MSIGAEKSGFYLLNPDTCFILNNDHWESQKDIHMSDSVIRAENILNRFKLNGRTALITGAAQGIGRAYAHALAEAGAKVAVVDVNYELAQQVVDEISERGGTAIAIHADVTDEASIQNACKQVKDDGEA